MEQRMGVPVGDYLAIVDGAPEVTFEDAADIFVKLRMIKTPKEVEYMRQAAAITGRARQRLFREVVPGMTERDVVRRLRALILAEGGDRTSFVHLISDFPVSQTQFHFERPLKRGSLLYIDAGRLRKKLHHRLRPIRDPGPRQFRADTRAQRPAGSKSTDDGGPATRTHLR